MKYFIVYILILAGIVACTIQPPKPQTPRQAIAYAYASLETAADAVAAAKANGLLDQTEIEAFKEILQEGVGHLVAAETLAAQYEGAIPAGVESDIQFRLSQVLAITSIITQMLCEARDECSDNRPSTPASNYSNSGWAGARYQF